MYLGFLNHNLEMRQSHPKALFLTRNPRGIRMENVDSRSRKESVFFFFSFLYSSCKAYTLIRYWNQWGKERKTSGSNINFFCMVTIGIWRKTKYYENREKNLHFVTPFFFCSQYLREVRESVQEYLAQICVLFPSSLYFLFPFPLPQLLRNRKSKLFSLPVFSD